MKNMWKKVLAFMLVFVLCMTSGHFSSVFASEADATTTTRVVEEVVKEESKKEESSTTEAKKKENSGDTQKDNSGEISKEKSENETTEALSEETSEDGKTQEKVEETSEEQQEEIADDATTEAATTEDVEIVTKEKNKKATTSTNLNQFITSVEGTDEAYSGETYQFTVHFAENMDYQFDDNNWLEYDLPEGVKGIEASGTSTITVNNGFFSFNVSGNQYEITENKIRYKFNVNDLSFMWLTFSGNVEFDVKFSAELSEDAQFKDSSGNVIKEVTLNTDTGIKVDKTGYYNSNEKKIYYTVTVSATGKNTDVVVTDTITGSALTYNDDLTVRGLTEGQYSSETSGNGFVFRIPSIGPKATAYIEYSASVDMDKITDGGTVEQTNNGVKITSKENTNPDEDDHHKEINFEKQMSTKSSISKSGVYSDKVVTWTVVYNSEQQENVSGAVVTDTLKDSANQSFKGPVTVQKFDGSSQEYEPVEAVAAPTGNTWSYTIPEESKPCKYVFTYQTEISDDYIDSLNADGTVENEVSAKNGEKESGPSTGKVGIPASEENKASIAKKVNKRSSDTVEWLITITVPANGLSEAQVVDVLPSVYDTYKDTLNSMEVVSGLLDGEQAQIDTENATITFTKDGQPGLKASSEKREIVVKVVTNNDKDWVEAAKTQTYLAEHTNTAKLMKGNVELDRASASVNLSVDTSIKKTGTQGTVWDNTYGMINVYIYDIIVSGVTGDLHIEDTFNTEVLEICGTPKIYGGGQYYQGDGEKEITFTPSSTGGSFDMSASELPNSGGTLYSHYKVSYYLKLKDGVESKLAELAVKNKGAVYIGNEASFEGNSDHADFYYNYPNVNKELLNAGSINASNKVAEYKITINKDAIQMNQGKTMAFVDEFNSSLSIQYSTIDIKDSNGNSLNDQVTYNAKGNQITFNVPDGKTVIITYKALVNGNSDNVPLKNSISWEGYSSESNQNVDIKSESSGTASIYSIKLLKVDSEENSKKLAGAKFKLYYAKDDQPVTDTEFVTDNNGLVTIQGSMAADGWTLFANQEYYIQETQPPTGYQKSDTKYKFTIDPKNGADYDKFVYNNGDEIMIKNKLEENPKGNLELTKTIKGDVTEEEAEGAIKFVVTGPEYPTGRTITLKDKDVEKSADGKTYTIKLDNIKIGEYTVEETTKDVTGKDVTVTYKVGAGDATEGTSATATVEKGATVNVDFENDYSTQKGNLELTKTIKGDVTEEEAEGAITFKVTGPEYPDGKEYRLTDKEVVKEGKKYTIKLDNIKIGEYTVEETTKDVNGKDVTVTYKVGTGEATEGTSATATVEKGATVNVDFENDYEDHKGNLELTKTIKGDVTAEEAEGAITFKVTGPEYPDGKEYRLTDKEVVKEGKKYTIKLDNIKIGEYTVEETTKDVTGKDVTVTYKIGTGDATEGTSATATVEKGATVNVDFENDYAPQKAGIKLTKTIKGDVTAEEAEGAIKFVVTGPEYPTGRTITLKDKDVEKSADGKTYTINLNDIKIGTYTVVETTKDVTGKDVTVTYKINNGDAQTGESAEVALEKGQAITVAFENDYEAQKGNLELTKTIKGDVTAEEAEGAIKFVVTGPEYPTGKEYKLTDKEVVKSADGKTYTIKLDNIKIGEYTVEETTKDVTGKDVTVTYKVGTGEATEGTSATATVEKGATVNVDFENDYAPQKAGIKLTKTIKGDVTAEEAEGAIKFVVTGPEYPTGRTITLKDKDVEKSADGKTYTINLNDIKIGTYTVVETTKDVTGKDVTVTYKIDNGDAQTGDSAEVALEKGQAITVAFENDYKAQKGNLEITKTIKGDVTAEEAEGKLEFTITGPEYGKEGLKVNLTNKQYVTKNADGTYTIKLDNIKIGEYTVTESTKDIDGNTVAVSYKINSGESQTSDSAKVNVEKEETAYVDFENDYTAKTAKISVTKTVKGLSDDAKEANKDYEYTFTITKAGETKPAATLKVKAGETKTTGDLPFGTYHIAETTQPSIDTYVFDKMVMDPADGNVTIDDDTTNTTIAVTAENQFKELGTKFVPQVTKEVTGDADKVPTDENGKPYLFKFGIYTSLASQSAMSQISVEAGKTGDFPEYEYQRAGTYEYYIKEIISNDQKLAGMTYSTDIVKATVETEVVNTELEVKSVKYELLDKNGNLKKDDCKTITNDFKQPSATANFSGTKVYKDHALDGFSFIVTAAEGTPMPAQTTVTSDANGKFTFGPITYTDPGSEKVTYTYTVTEEKGNDKTVVYDSSSKEVKVVVEKASDGAITATVNQTDVEKLSFTNKTTSVSIKKVDITDSKELKGAHIQILKEDGSLFTEWDSDTTAHEVTGLNVGETYTLKETVPADGYTITSDTTFVLKEDGTVDKEKTTTTVKDGILLVEDSMSSATFKKTDVANHEIEGATLKITDADGNDVKDVKGNVIKEWTSKKDESHVVEGLKDGTYKLIEITQPDGYVKAEEIEFTIKDGKVKGTENDTVTMVDDYSKVTISKTDIAGEEIPGATLKIVDKDGELAKNVNGEEIKPWETDGKTQHPVEGLKDGTYKLVEVTQPDGYVKAEEIEFTIKDGKVVDHEDGKLTMVDNYSKVNIKKTDIAGKEIPGAELKITDENGNEVKDVNDKTIAPWTTDGKTEHSIEGLKDGKYILVETTAPKGYKVAESIKFEIKDGKVVDHEDATITMVDQYAEQTVKVSKWDITNNKELPGATLQILDKSNNVIMSWVSTTTPKEITGLKVGETYILRETVAPEGYNLTTDTIFEVDMNGNITCRTNTRVVNGVIFVDDTVDRNSGDLGNEDKDKDDNDNDSDDSSNSKNSKKNKGDSSGNSSGSNTGDASSAGTLMLLLLSGAALVILGFKRKKENA